MSQPVSEVMFFVSGRTELNTAMLQRLAPNRGFGLK